MERLLNSIFLLLLFCVGCGVEIQDKEQKNAPPLDATPMVQTAGTFTAEQFKIMPVGSTPQIYDLHLSWPTTTGDVAVLIDDKEVFRAPAANSLGTLKSIPSERTTNLRIRHYDPQNNLVSSFEKSVTTPKDLVLGTMTLNSSQEITADRIFLMKNAVITAGPYSLTLTANELHADEAVIESFPRGAVASDLLTPASGGTFKLYAAKGVGKLHIFLRGENGMTGKPNTAPEMSPCSGSMGGNGGNAANLTVKILDISKMNFSYSVEPGRGGKAGHEIDRPANAPPLVCTNPFFGPVTNGKDGKPGTVQILN